jgi:hypothetical protein
MRIASRFQRPGRSNDRRARALTSGVCVGLISFGCFFELEPLEPSDGGIGGGGTFGAVGGEGGDAPIGGDGGGGGAGIPPQDDCEQAGEKRCNGQCVIANPENGCGNPDCAPCAVIPNGVPSCSGDSASCKVGSCNPGFADCDGDTQTYDGVSGGNGCEYSFGTIGGHADPLVVPRALIRLDDNSRDDWSGISAYQLEEICVECNDSVLTFQPSAQNEAPPGSDLSAYFRVAWDANFFYVLAEGFDDHVFHRGSTVENGGCQTSSDGNNVPGPTCEDAFAVYFDGLQNGQNISSNEVHRVFLGTSGTSFAPAQGQPGNAVGMRVLTPPGPHCYRMEAQFDWKYLVSNQGQPVPGKFPPAEDQTYGFDIAVSDWDPSVSDESRFERQSQLFWSPRAQQSELHPSVAGIGTIILEDSSDDPQ